MPRLRRCASLAIDAAGKLWTAPNTLAGLLLGAVGLLAGSRAALAHNAIVFHAFPLGKRGFVLGNVIINPTADLEWHAATYDSVTRRKKGGSASCVMDTVHVGR